MTAAVTMTTGGMLAVYLTGAVGAEIGRDLSMSAGRLGAAVAAFFAASSACASVSGRLADRFGSAAVVRLAAVPAIASLASIAALVHTWATLLVAMVVAGVGNGAIQPAANRFLTRTVTARRQGLAFGVKQAAIPAATLLSGLTVPLVALTVGWRWAFAGAALFVVAAVARFPRRSRARLMAARIAGSADSGEPPLREPRPAALLMLSAGQALGAAATVALGSFFVVAVTATGVRQGTAGLIAAAGSVACLVVRIGSGRLADRRPGAHLGVVAAYLLTGTVGLLLLAVGQPYLALPAAILAYGAGWGWPGLLNFGVARLHPGMPGRATGVLQSGAGLGGALGPLAFGYTSSAVGFSTAWVLAAVTAAAAAALILAGRRAVLGEPRILAQ